MQPLNKSDVRWAIKTITEKDEEGNKTPEYQQTHNLINLYHALDHLLEFEEDRVDMRHAIYYHVFKMKKKTPTFMRLRLATWLSDYIVWKDEKEEILRRLTPQ